MIQDYCSDGRDDDNNSDQQDIPIDCDTCGKEVVEKSDAEGVGGSEGAVFPFQSLPRNIVNIF